MSTMEQVEVAKYQPYPEYKDSGVEWLGLIPKHWALRRAKFIFQRIQRPVRDIDGIVTAFRDGQVTLRSNRRIDGFTNALQEIGYQGVRKGDLLIHAMDGFAGAIGISDSDGKCSPVCSVCTPISKTLAYPAYYGYLIRQLAVTGFITSLSKGIRERSTEFRFSEFSPLGLALPPHSEQRTIAAFLDYETARIDKLIAQQQRLIELLKEKRQAVISHAVTKGLNPDAPMKDSGVEWLGEVPEHWIVAGFKKYIEPIVDYRGKTPTKTESGVFLVTARNIKNGIIDYSLSEEFISDEDYEEVMRRGKPKIGDVLFTTEAPLGEVAQIDNENIALAQRIIKFRGKSNVLDCSYLKLFIQSTEFQQGLMTFATGSTALGIKSDRLSYLKQFVPPLTEQTQIVEAVKEHSKKYEKLIEVASQAIEHMQERRTALVSAAVTGKIDLRGWAALTKEVSNG